MTLLSTRIVIFDDDCCHNTLAVFAFKKLFSHLVLDIFSFTSPEEGLKFLEAESAKQTSVHSILLLDINMPVINGWQVLDWIEHMPADIAKDLSVYILSASVNNEDVRRSENHPLVEAYLVKPLADHLSYLLDIITESGLKQASKKRYWRLYT